VSGDLVEITIVRIGAGGDGIAEHDGTRLFVPLALPGERLRVRLGPARGEGRVATLVERLTDSADRVAPPCRHFGRCGGCALQHLAAPAYSAWKRDLVIEALARRGLDDVAVDAILTAPPGDRRRVTLSAFGRKGGALLGFSEANSHTLVDIEDCRVMAPDLAALLPALRAALTGLLPGGTRAQVVATETETGIDLLVEGDLTLDLKARERLAAFAEGADIARLSFRRPGGAAETIAQRRRPMVRFAGVAAELPPGAFLQASRSGEAALIAAVAEGVAGAKRILDLFCGIGTFSLPLAQSARVTAMEGDVSAVAALSQASAARNGRLSVQRRDLARDPPRAAELARFDAVVFDPPRAGAKPVAEALAQSKVPCVVAVSCHPATFARDARILVDGGYRLVRVLPVDQFLWSPHVEIVATFHRPS